MILVRTEIDVYSKMQDEINNEYVPVRLTDPDHIPVGNIYQDQDGRIKSRSLFSIQNNSNQEQSITFLLYQHYYKIEEDQLFVFDQLFDLEHVYTCNDSDTEVEMENGVIKISGGETMKIHVIGIARDCSKAQVSGTSPSVKIIKLKYVF